MTELKTLKDINEDFLQKKGYDILCPTAFKLLKQEAIKDIKELGKFTQRNDCDCCGGNHKTGSCCKIQYIKWKFNITEEDLKGGNEK